MCPHLQKQLITYQYNKNKDFSAKRVGVGKKKETNKKEQHIIWYQMTSYSTYFLNLYYNEVLTL
jgi:hypothetical protein